jgi:hypothetical protein
MPSLSSPPCSPRIDTLVAADAETESNVAYLAKLDQPFGSLIDLTGETWITPTLTYSNYINEPAFTQRQSTRRYTTERGVFGVCENNERDGEAYAFSCPTVPGATIVEELWLWQDSVGQHVYSLETSTPIDLMGTAITGPTQDGIIDQVTRVLSWPERAGAAPQFVIARVFGSGTSQNPFQWEIVAPYGGASLTLPTLIGEGAVYTDPGEAGGVIWLGTAEGGYDAIRQLGPMSANGVRVNAATGRVVLTAYES